MMMEVAGGVIIGLAVVGSFALGFYAHANGETEVGGFLFLLSIAGALWVFMS